MKLKTATLWGMIGAIISIFITLFYLLINADVIEWHPAISIAINILSIVSSATLALFFYILYKNQK
jgi:hypothetical protein